MSRQPTVEEQQQYLNQIKTEVQKQMVQEMMNKMSESCIPKCIGKSGDGLDSSEKRCLANCMDRYMETMHVVTESMSSKQH